MMGSLHSSNSCENESFLYVKSAKIFTKKVAFYSFTANLFGVILSIFQERIL